MIGQSAQKDLQQNPPIAEFLPSILRDFREFPEKRCAPAQLSAQQRQVMVEEERARGGARTENERWTKKRILSVGDALFSGTACGACPACTQRIGAPRKRGC